MPTLREEHKVLTRNRVLDAAVAVFGGKPFVDATMDDIAKSAGVTRATVYAHFPGGKSDIIRALVERVYDSVDDVYAELTAVNRWTRAGVHAWLVVAAARWQGLAPTIRVLTTAGSSIARSSDGSGERYRTAHGRYVTMLADDVLRWPNTSEAEARQRVLMAVLQVESFLTVWVTGAWTPETADPLDLLADAVCHLLEPALHEPALLEPALHDRSATHD
jgi:AcrR family transcriptional regulator